MTAGVERVAETLEGRPLTEGAIECVDVTEPSEFTVEEIDPARSDEPVDDFAEVAIAGTLLYEIVPTAPTDVDCETT
jgi:hypothetical protein